ncbi:hypothetical protein QO004_005067 [Rhizobium mesoamericanum]|nr:hypothetical protein [Rhizobium mesoamericanum]
MIGISARFLDMLLGRRGNPILSAAMGVSLSTLLLVTSILVALWLRHRCHDRRPRTAAARAVLAARIWTAIGPPLAAAEPRQRHRTGHLYSDPRSRRVGTAIATCAALAVLSLGFVLMLAMQVKTAARMCEPI